MNDFTKEELEHIYDGLWMLSNLGWDKSDLSYCKSKPVNYAGFLLIQSHV